MEGLNNFFEHDFYSCGFASHKNIIGPLLTILRSKLVKQVSTEVMKNFQWSMMHPFIKYLHRTIRIGVKFLSIINGCCHPVEYC